MPAGDPWAQWDGHTTEQKYRRIRTHTAALVMSGDGTSSDTGT
ncbi:hypothetical protein ACFYXS_39295 [Streptomyces sp. NPDC002574]